MYYRTTLKTSTRNHPPRTKIPLRKGRAWKTRLNQKKLPQMTNRPIPRARPLRRTHRRTISSMFSVTLSALFFSSEEFLFFNVHIHCIKILGTFYFSLTYCFVFKYDYSTFCDEVYIYIYIIENLI